MAQNRICKTCRLHYKRGDPGTLWRFCSEKCSANFSYERPISPARTMKLSTATLGAVSELFVCHLLLAEGWHVFRSQSPASPVDVVAIKEGQADRKIEVRTGTFSPRDGVKRFDTVLNYPLLATEIAVFYPETSEVDFHPVSGLMANAQGMRGQ